LNRLVVGLASLALSGCAADVRDIGRAPHLSAIGSGLAVEADLRETFQDPSQAPGSMRSLWNDRGGDLFRDARAARIGDLVTVVIAINDSATFGNSSDRSRASTFTNSFDAAIATPMLTGKATGSANAAAGTSTKGEGNIVRSEKIQLSVAAVVTAVLPNGTLLISGSQEVRVNFELRELTVSGIVRPRDISRDNTITYDKVAEARIAYGGRGRITEVQQPALIHQILDLVRPF
jgi:flagellar L-ring protein FlgH